MPKEPTITSLSATIKIPRLENRKLNNRLSKCLLRTKNLENEIYDIHRGMVMKFNRLAKAVGKADAVNLYYD